MALNRYALVKGGKVVNVTEWDGDPPKWSPPVGVSAILADKAGPGWAYDGTTFTPPVLAAPVPEAVQPLQIRKAIRAKGLKTQVDLYVASVSEEKREAWEYAISIPRNHGLIIEAAAAMRWTEAQTDDLFRLAASL